MATVLAQPQNSRAGMITTLVVSLLLNGLLAVIFFKQNSDSNKLQKDFDDTKRRYADAISESVFPNSDYTAARDQAKEQSKAGAPMTVFDVQVAQRNSLATAIAGTPVPSPDVRDRAEQAIKENNAKLAELSRQAEAPAIPGNNLIDGLARWPGVVQKVLQQREQLKKDLEAAAEKLKTTDAANQQALAEKDKAIADAKAETAKATDQTNQLTQTQSTALAGVQAGANQSISNLTQQLATVQATVAQRDVALADVNKRAVRLLSALRKFKANPAVKDNMVRVPDGEVKTVAGNTCFINLGQGDQISVGMTFEVYDPNKGIPPLGDGTSTPEPVARRTSSAAAAAGVPGIVTSGSSISDDKYEFELPKGKGSIEVINVGPDHTSQCRIIHTEPGQTLSQGDLIANLVYDRNIKYNFVVYGDFDLANSNASSRTNNDARAIQRLIEQWGGQVQPIADPAKPADAVTPMTDFLIVGKEPQVPNFTAEDLNDPANQLIAEKAKAKLDAYRSVLGKAADFGIPVLNQNRFLYYTGFFDQAKR